MNIKSDNMHNINGFMPFHTAVQSIAEQMDIDADDTDWIGDAIFIARCIKEEMCKKDYIYYHMLHHLATTATFYRGFKVDVPLDFDQYLRFRLPFSVAPIFNTVQPGIISLYTQVRHPMVTNNLLDPERIQLLLRGNLRLTIDKLQCIKIMESGVEYQLTYCTSEIGDQGFLHEINAREVREMGPPRIISFVFVPAVEFQHAEYPLPHFVPRSPDWTHCNNGAIYWLALLQVYPNYGQQSFCPYVPQMQLIRDHRLLKYRQVMQLLLNLGIGHNITNISTIYLIKGLHFYRLRYSHRCDCNSSLATIFMELLYIHGSVMWQDANQQQVIPGQGPQHFRQEAQRLNNVFNVFYHWYSAGQVRLEQMRALFNLQRSQLSH